MLRDTDSSSCSFIMLLFTSITLKLFDLVLQTPYIMLIHQSEYPGTGPHLHMHKVVSFCSIYRRGVLGNTGRTRLWLSVQQTLMLIELFS
jgi:hypothetical protein